MRIEWDDVALQDRERILNFFIHSIHWPRNKLMMRLNLPLSRC
ncbi:hypothetical protein HAP32_02936 [Serratia fonticola]|nr:hypothetical protein HAP32_02936 [Serratia fonticola]